MDNEGERSAPDAGDDWWNRLYDDTSADTAAGAQAAPDTLDDRFASASRTLSSPPPPDAPPPEAYGPAARDAPAATPRRAPAGEGQRDARDPRPAGAGPGVGPVPAAPARAAGPLDGARRPRAWWEHAPGAPREAPPCAPADAVPLPSPGSGAPAPEPPEPDPADAEGPAPDRAGPGGSAPGPADSGGAGAAPRDTPEPAAEPDPAPGHAGPRDAQDAGERVPPLPRRPAPPAVGHGAAPVPARPWDAPRHAPAPQDPPAGPGPRADTALPPRTPAAAPPQEPRPWMPPAPPETAPPAPTASYAPPAPPGTAPALTAPYAPPAPTAAPAPTAPPGVGHPAPPADTAAPARPGAGAGAPAAPAPAGGPAAPIEAQPRPRVGFVGFRPPTYDPEPTALPLASSGTLDRVVPDTVLDGARYGTYTLRAASVRGDSARYRGEPRRDALLTARFGAGADALVLVAVASGARAADEAHRAAADACHWIGEAVCRSHPRLADDIKDGRADALKSGLHRLTDRTYGRLRARAAERDLDPAAYTASLRCLLLSADPRVRLRVFFGVGTGGLFLLRDHEWRDLEPGLPTSAARPAAADESGPDEPEAAGPLAPRPGDAPGTLGPGVPTARTPRAEAAAPAPDQPFRFHAATARAGDTLLLCGDGLAEPLRGEPGLAGALGARWSAQEPPGLVEFLADVQLRTKGYADDRTAVGVWEA
ncbi:protein phosphatase 2C domain-containing protein [Streptomyces sp. NPDC047002]|uniref:protein phosphatase 2C domain-containing protein n=1 Tax=Streptomyces sp. NPDC047002 TaxID=3155475 RepID=UPI0034559304